MNVFKTIKNINPIMQGSLAFALFVVSVLLTRNSTIPGWEIDMFKFFYSLPSFMHTLFFFVTQFGSVYILVLLLIIYLLRKRYHIVLRLLMTGSLAYLSAGVIKDILGRGRPYEFLHNVINLDVIRGSGFPSGHMALATALALTMGHYLPKKYHWIIPVWILGVGISRLILGVHFPMDIVGGFAIGWGSYALFRLVRIYDISLKRQKNTNIS